MEVRTTGLTKFYNSVIKSGSFKIVLIYITISLLWIFSSDYTLYIFRNTFNAATYAIINSGKGVVFVIGTGTILFF